MNERKGVPHMKKAFTVFAAALICFCITGCTKGDPLTKQKDTVPTVPAENTETVTIPTDTGIRRTETTAAEIRTTSAASLETAPPETTQPPQTDAVKADDSAGASASDFLYGKWETVSFAKSTGERMTYDLSDPVHRSYYVGLDLRSVGQSALTVGTERFPATIAVNGDTLFVWKAATETA